jgi:hypothetical protein
MDIFFSRTPHLIPHIIIKEKQPERIHCMKKFMGHNFDLQLGKRCNLRGISIPHFQPLPAVPSHAMLVKQHHEKNYYYPPH